MLEISGSVTGLLAPWNLISFRGIGIVGYVALIGLFGGIALAFGNELSGLLETVGAGEAVEPAIRQTEPRLDLIILGMLVMLDDPLHTGFIDVHRPELAARHGYVIAA